MLSIFVIIPKKHVSSISAVDGSTKNTLRFRKKMKKFTTPLFYDPSIDEIPISNFFGFDAFLNICSIPSKDFHILASKSQLPNLISLFGCIGL